MSLSNRYKDPKLVAKIEGGRHREFFGGMWDIMGDLQFQYLRRAGLKTGDRMLDIGCGALRGGVHFVRYLDAGNYHGSDLVERFLDVGYVNEIHAAGLQDRLPRENLQATPEFDFSGFKTKFDIGLAFSVFTHLPLNDIRTCLERWQEVAASDAILYATYFGAPIDRPTRLSFEQVRGITTYGDRDPYHYHRSDLHYIASTCGLTALESPPLDHPRNQIMMKFVRAR